ncbi:M81 family metallopeptidase [Horticoccus sp. 23ND18S-11]|uniref:M81 family metallopeptidase n=1 Tax=Horticoccus sp. 23ND18S-11 TaxID=3391832 RepID=UPI0039C8D65F
MKSRILFGGLFHETHAFLPEVTRWSDFKVTFGADILSKEGDESPTDGFLGEAKRFGWEVLPTVDARAMPSGPVEDQAFETFWTEFERRARPLLAAGVDAIYLVLHGAMTTQSIEDVEGELLARIRALPGAAQLPIFGVLDLHGNISSRMCALGNGFVAYRKNPHTDAKVTAIRAAGLLERCLRTGRVPRMNWCRVPLIWAPPGTGTHSDPMLALTQLAEKAETGDPAVWAYNVMGGFSFADTAESGVTLSTVSDAAMGAVRPHLEAGAALAWALRDKGVVTYPSVDDVLRKIGPAPAGPVLLVEPADNVGGGAPGDCTGILRAMLAHQVSSGLVAINDPAAVQRLGAIPVGSTVRLAIGGHAWPLDPGPVELDLTLVSRSDGNFELEDIHSHMASMNGTQIAMGPCAVVRHAGITILLTSRKTPPFDLGQFRSQGIEPRAFAIIGIKAAVAHRQAYDPIAVAEYFVDTPGPCSSNLASFPFKRLRHPVYPIDSITEPKFIIT